MTATLPRPSASPAGRPTTRPPARPERDTAAARRTLLAALACALGVLPLKALFRDDGWILDTWLSIVVVLGPAALLRLRRPPGALDVWPGIVLLVPFLTAHFLSASAVAGVVPTTRTWDLLSVLLDELHRTTSQDVAPIHTTVAVRLVLCALVGLFAALVDLVAVVGRRAALAGVPLLVVFTVAGAVPRTTVSWVWFVPAALAFLLLLALDAHDDTDRWGRRVRTAGGTRTRTALSVTAPRIAVAALVAAVLLPALVPGDPRNLLSDAFHGVTGSADGFGGGSSGRISPFASLKGQLERDKPKQLATVSMLSGPQDRPYYLRVNVLSNYTPQGWRSSGSHGTEYPADSGSFPLTTATSVATAPMEARISISGMRGNPPVFANPNAVAGLDTDTTWASSDQLLLGSEIGSGDRITESFDQPSPTLDQLRQADALIDEDVRKDTVVPRDLPTAVRNLVADTVRGRPTQYGKARAISDFFADPENGFAYDLKTQTGDSGSDLVDFLNNRRGYCQQYAAAMAVMLRVAGVPARVVLGYLHKAPNRNGTFTVTTSDAHSWVEAWFDGLGWVPFDPTPAAGLGGRASELQWAPRQSQSTAPTASASGSSSSVPSARPTASAASSSAAAPVARRTQGGGTSLTPLWVLGIVVLVLALSLAPALARTSRRRRRVALARGAGDAGALWDELADTATDLGYVWSPSRSPRQVADWLAGDAPRSGPALHALAGAVERQRYAGRGAASAGTATDEWVTGLDAARGELRAGRPRRVRVLSRLFPASLGWTPRSRRDDLDDAAPTTRRPGRRRR